MIKKLFTLLITAVITINLCSCLDSSSSSTSYNDTAITSFSIGTLKKQVHTTSSTGEDSVYTTTVSGSSYNFTIDHYGKQIYNKDSLPYLTIPKALVTLTTDNSGVACWVSTTSDDTLYSYSSSDSVEFYQPRKLTVFSSNGNADRTYTVTVNVHKEDSSTVHFTEYENIPDEFKSSKYMDIHCIDEYLYVLCKNKSGDTTHVYRASINNADSWTKLTTNMTLSGDMAETSTASETMIYAINNGDIIATSDGSNWATIASGVNFDKMIGATDYEMYALNNGTIYVSNDYGYTWNADKLGDPESYLPLENISFFYRPVDGYADYVRMVIVGTRDYFDDAKIWSKLVNISNSSDSGEWLEVEAGTHTSPLPAYTSLTVAPYGYYMVACGASTGNEDYDFDITDVKISKDFGLTWQKDTTLTNTITANVICPNKQLRTATDKTGRIWMVCGGSGSVYSFFKNIMLWRTRKKYFNS